MQNWESNTLGPSSFDGLVSIECLARIENKSVFFHEVQRVLRPGKRAVLTVWRVQKESRKWKHRHLLEPICREGRLPGTGSRDEYTQLLESAGLHLVEFQDLSQRVRKT